MSIEIKITTRTKDNATNAETLDTITLDPSRDRAAHFMLLAYINANSDSPASNKLRECLKDIKEPSSKTSIISKGNAAFECRHATTSELNARTSQTW